MATQTRPGIEIFEDTDTRLDPPYHVVLLDDDHHTYPYVIRMLGAIFGYSKNKGFALACMVDRDGRAIVMTGSRDEAERKQQQIHAFGPDPAMADSLGSMSAIIEPAC
jgi:ATP-dependent Clp protease adaptor protein ClpS